MALVSTWLPLFIGLSYLTFSLAAPGDFGSHELSKPQRPRVFTSTDELRNYLEALGRYYALAGRNRYGKRSAALQQSSPHQIPAILVPNNRILQEEDK